MKRHKCVYWEEFEKSRTKKKIHILMWRRKKPAPNEVSACAAAICVFKDVRLPNGREYRIGLFRLLTHSQISESYAIDLTYRRPDFNLKIFKFMCFFILITLSCDRLNLCHFRKKSQKCVTWTMSCKPSPPCYSIRLCKASSVLETIHRNTSERGVTGSKPPNCWKYLSAPCTDIHCDVRGEPCSCRLS